MTTDWKLGDLGTMKLVATDQFRGRGYRCGCGGLFWTAWANAKRHAKACPKSGLDKRAPEAGGMVADAD